MKKGIKLSLIITAIIVVVIIIASAISSCSVDTVSSAITITLNDTEVGTPPPDLTWVLYVMSAIFALIIGGCTCLIVKLRNKKSKGDQLTDDTGTD